MMRHTTATVKTSDETSILIEEHERVKQASPLVLAGYVLAGTETDRTDRRAVLARLAAVALAAYLSGVRTGGER